MGYVLFGLGLAFQVAMLIHAVRTRREQMWIYAIAFIPLAASVAYFAVEFLPWMLRSPEARRAAAAMHRAIDPERDLRRYAAQARLSDALDAKLKLAAELAQTRHYDEAARTYRQCLRGMYEHEPKILLALASVEFEQGDYAGAQGTLERLQEHNPGYKSAEGHMLYARALELSGALERARDEYGTLSEYYPGAEAKGRYAALALKLGDTPRALEAFREIVDGAELAPRHVRKLNREWIDLARRELAVPR